MHTSCPRSFLRMKAVESLPPLTLSALELQPEAGFLAQSMCIHPKASLSHRNRDCLLHEVPHYILLATPGEAIVSLRFEVHHRSKGTNTPFPCRGPDLSSALRRAPWLLQSAPLMSKETRYRSKVMSLGWYYHISQWPVSQPGIPSPRQRVTNRPLCKLERKLTCSQGQLSLPESERVIGKRNKSSSYRFAGLSLRVAWLR